jgi:hypothetical protein
MNNDAIKSTAQNLGRLIPATKFISKAGLLQETLIENSQIKNYVF